MCSCKFTESATLYALNDRQPDQLSSSTFINFGTSDGISFWLYGKALNNTETDQLREIKFIFWCWH